MMQKYCSVGRQMKQVKLQTKWLCMQSSTLWPFFIKSIVVCWCGILEGKTSEQSPQYCHWCDRDFSVKAIRAIWTVCFGATSPHVQLSLQNSSLTLFTFLKNCSNIIPFIPAKNLLRNTFLKLSKARKIHSTKRRWYKI